MAGILICAIPLVTLLIILLILVKDLKFWTAIYSVILGLLAVVPAVILQTLIARLEILSTNSLSDVLINSILVNGVFEETIKMLFLLFIPCKKKSLSLFIVCVVLTGFAFASFENLVYFIDGHQFALRYFTAILIHLLCGILSGIFVYSIKHSAVIIMPLIYSIILHGFYNYFAGFKMNVPLYYFSFAVLLFALAEVRLQYRKLSEEL